MKLLAQFRDYFQPADERIELELNRTYARIFNGLIMALLVLVFYCLSFSQLLSVHNVPGSDGFSLQMLVITQVIFFLVFVASAVASRKAVELGTFVNLKIVNEESFPASFSSKFSVFSCALVAIVLFLTRSIAEIQIVPIDQCFFYANAILGGGLAVFLFPLIYAGLYLTWKEARSKADELARELED